MRDVNHAGKRNIYLVAKENMKYCLNPLPLKKLNFETTNNMLIKASGIECELMEAKAHYMLYIKEAMPYSSSPPSSYDSIGTTFKMDELAPHVAGENLGTNSFQEDDNDAEQEDPT